MNKLTKTVVIIASSLTLCGVLCMGIGSALGGDFEKTMPGMRIEVSGDDKNSSGSRGSDKYYGNGGYHDKGSGDHSYGDDYGGGGYGSDDFGDDELDEFFRSFGFGDDFFDDFFGGDDSYGEMPQEEQL